MFQCKMLNGAALNCTMNMDSSVTVGSLIANLTSDNPALFELVGTWSGHGAAVVPHSMPLCDTAK